MSSQAPNVSSQTFSIIDQVSESITVALTPGGKTLGLTMRPRPHERHLRTGHPLSELGSRPRVAKASSLPRTSPLVPQAGHFSLATSAAYLTREGRISVRTSRALPAQAPEPIATGRPIRGLGIVIFPLEVSH